MKTWRWILVFLAAGSIAAACTTKSSSSDDDGAGGTTSTTTGQGAAAATSNNSATTGSPTSSSAAPSSSTATGCDTGTGMDISSPQCDACITCTQSGDCQTEWSVCTQGMPCGTFIQCLSDCDTQFPNDPAGFATCVGTDVADPNDQCNSTGGCIAAEPTGCSDYLTALSCSVCQFCPGDCDAAGNCS